MDVLERSPGVSIDQNDVIGLRGRQSGRRDDPMILLFKMSGMEEFDVLHEMKLQTIITGYMLDIGY